MHNKGHALEKTALDLYAFASIENNTKRTLEYTGHYPRAQSSG